MLQPPRANFSSLSFILESPFFDQENQDDDEDDLVAAAPHCVICGLYGLGI
jgi:hypothetical protein